MKIYIDCEFNEFKGELISMALVAEDGAEFYEVLECKNPKPWVLENVIPVLNKDPVPDYIFKMKLFGFLNWFDTIELIADYPDDIKYFCEWVVIGFGEMMNIPKFSCELRRDLTTKNSKILHNALSDARALMESNKENTV